MKRLSLLTAFIFCAIVSFAQFVPNPQGTAQQVTQFRGAVTGLRGTIITPNDTTNSPATPYFGALTVLPTDAGKADIPIWMSNGIYWIRFTGGTATNINDTIYTRIPIRVDTTSFPGHRILYLLHADGIESPGYVVWTGTGLNFNVTPSVYDIGFRQFNSPIATVTLAPASVFVRKDLFIVDTNALASALTGAAGGTTPQTNPSSQLPLTDLTINPGDTIPGGVQLITLYNENLGNPNEFQTGTAGTITVNYNNTDNPYIGAKAAFVSSYQNGGQLTFTSTSIDTVQPAEILRGFIWFNIPFLGRQLQFQWFNGSTAVSNSIAVSASYGINPNNTGTYQIFAIPLNAFNFISTGPSGNLFNKLVITMAGQDTSGGGGFYIDYLQLQTGIINIEQPPPPAWLITGNSGTNVATNFLGTIDNTALAFRINNLRAGYIGTTADYNISMGVLSLPPTSTGIKNTGLGGGALGLNTTGFNNTGVGYTANYHNTTGNYNTAVGWAAIGWNIGTGNTAIGNEAYNSRISSVSAGSFNTAVGYQALEDNFSNSYNIGLGVNAGDAAAQDSTFYVSPKTPHMIYRIDTATGTAPAMIGYNPVTGEWHHYANTGGGGGGNNIYNIDSSLSSDRTVDLNGKFLKFTEGGNSFLEIDPVSKISSLRGTDGTSFASLDLNGDSGGIVSFLLDANNSSNDVNIAGSAGANSLTYTAATHTFNGSIIYNTPVGGTSTDSVLTRDGSTGIVNMRDPSGLVSLQNAFDVSVARADNPSINGHNNSLTMDSIGLMSITSRDVADTFNNLTNLFLTPNYLQYITSATSLSGSLLRQSQFSMQDNTIAFQSNLTDAGVTKIHGLEVNSDYVRIKRSDGIDDFLPARFVLRTDSITVNPNNVAFLDGDTLKRGHLSVSSLVAGADLTAQSAAVSSIATYTPTANGTYRIGGYINVTAIVTNVITLKVTYTDINSNAVTQIIPLTLAATGAVGTTATIVGNNSATDIQIRAKSGSAITVLTTATGVGSETYDVGVTIEKLR